MVDEESGGFELENLDESEQLLPSQLTSDSFEIRKLTASSALAQPDIILYINFQDADSILVAFRCPRLNLEA